MTINIQDVYKRLNRLSESSSTIVKSPRTEAAYKRALEQKRPSDMMFCIEHWEELPGSNYDLKFASVLEVFELLTDVGSTGQVRKMGAYILNEVVAKLRDANQTSYLIKRKLSRTKTKATTKINSALQDAIEKMNGINNIVTSAMKSPSISSNNTKEANANEAAIALIEMYNTVVTNTHCDRILTNYNQISGRFNIDRVISENADPYDMSFELCRLIDTYDKPSYIKFNTVIETAFYGLNKLSKPIDMKRIVEAATDFFVLKEGGLEDCRSILSSAVVVKPEDMAGLDYIIEDEPEENETTVDAADAIEEFASSLYTEAEVSNANTTIRNIPRIVTSNLSNGKVLDKDYADNYDTLYKSTITSELHKDAEKFNKAKHQAILEAKNLVEAYNQLLEGELDRAINTFKDGSYSLAKNLVQTALNILNVENNSYFASPDEIKNMIKSHTDFFKSYDDPNKVKAAIQKRLDYCELVTRTFKGILDENYKLFGFSEEEAKALSSRLASGDNSAIGDVKAKFIEHPELFKKDWGYDFRKFKGGVVYITKEELGDIAGSMPPERMIQLSFEYDCIVFGHGSARTKGAKSLLATVDAVNMGIINSLGQAIISNNPSLPALIKKYNKLSIKQGLGEIPNDIASWDDKKRLSFGGKFLNKAKSIEEEIVSKYGVRTIQKIDTESGKSFTDVDDLLIYLAKTEHKKKILLFSCNPYNLDVSKKVYALPGVKIKLAHNSIIADSTIDYSADMTTYGPYTRAMAHLRLYAENHGIDFDNDEYLIECMTSYDSDVEALNEGIASGAWEKVKDFIKRVIAAIVGFVKRIIGYFGKLINAIKEKIKGISKDKAPADTTFKTPIILNIADPKTGKVIEKPVNTAAEFDKVFTESLNNILNEFEKKLKEWNNENDEIMDYVENKMKLVKDNSHPYHAMPTNPTAADVVVNNTKHESFVGVLMGESFSLYNEAANEDDDSTNVDFKKILDEFKRSNEPNKESKLKQLVTKLYTRSGSNIANETPNFLQWIRQAFVLGTFAINPVVGAVINIADQFIRLHKQRNETKKMLDAISEERRKVKQKLAKSKDLEDEHRLKQYDEALDSAYKKIDEYYDSLLTDKEVDAKYSDDDDAELDSLKDLLDFNDDDPDDDLFFEQAQKLSEITNIIEYAVENIGKVDGFLESINKVPNQAVDFISEFSMEYPGLVSPDKLIDIMKENRKLIRNNKVTFSTISERYLRLDTYNSNIAKLEAYTESGPKELCSIEEAYEYSSRLNEAFGIINDFNQLYKGYSPLLELSFENQLKLAQERVKKFFTKLNDKQKSISKSIDVNTNNMKKAIEKSLTNDNRESIIRGSILPSASKCIKMALASGAIAVFVSPAIAVIAMLGYIGTSAKYKAKERQMVIDEIETELTMTNKYIQIAEDKNDMKAMKQLLVIKRNLERQRQRIKYKMKVDFGQKVYDTHNTPTDGVD